MRKSNSQSPPQAARKFQKAESSHELQHPTDHNYMLWPKNAVLTTLKIDKLCVGFLLYKNKYGSWRKCAVLELHQDAKDTTMMKQMSGGTLGLQISDPGAFFKHNGPGE